MPKLIQGDAWHCCRNCRYWPERRDEYVERNSKPVSGHLSDRCEIMIREGHCAPLATIH